MGKKEDIGVLLCLVMGEFGCRVAVEMLKGATAFIKYIISQLG